VFSKLFLLFIIVPIIELFLFIRIGSKLGLPLTLAIIVITAFLGAALAKSQGRLTMMKFQQAMGSGKMPHNEVLDGLMILLAGAVLLTPGFLTDAVGFALLCPPIRTLIRERFADQLKDKIHVSMPQTEPRAQKPKSNLDDGNVIDV